MTGSDTVFVVTASRGNADVLSSFLMEHGLNVETATTLDEFEAYLSSPEVAEKTGAVLIDGDGFSAEIWSGVELLHKKQIPFIVVSKHREVTAQAEEYDATGLFEKPLKQEVLLNAINGLLDQ